MLAASGSFTKQSEGLPATESSAGPLHMLPVQHRVAPEFRTLGRQVTAILGELTVLVGLQLRLTY